MTRFIGLTGGIGAGKSEALAAASRLGAATISTDQVAHEVLERDDVRALLVERWGDEVAPGGSVDRRRVAEIVFERPEELAWLESQTHPRVGRTVADWRAKLDPEVEVAVLEVPLLFEAGMEAGFDETLVVIAEDSVRERRLAERGQPGLEGREQRQLSQEQKAERADHVIRNDGSLEQLERAVAVVLESG
ncbi:MAG: dephospho-CoA kinase [Actinomycetota bacterium]|nr:dephospho-CoA kinase [Actinomycetota bacterium]